MVFMHLANLCSMSTMQSSIGVSIAWASRQLPSVTVAMEERVRFPQLRTNTQGLRRCLFEIESLFTPGFDCLVKPNSTRDAYISSEFENTFAKCCPDCLIEQRFAHIWRVAESIETVRR